MSDGTSLIMLDTRRGCRTWARSLDALAYEADTRPGQALVRLDVVDPLTRFFEGQAALDVDSGATVAIIDGECTSACQPNDGDVAPADFQPAGAPRPVPAFAAGGWPRDTTLPFGWLSGAVPPDWARTAVVNGATDASQTSASRSPRFVFRGGAADTIRYTPQFPGFCRYGIACASRRHARLLGGLAASARHGLQLGHPALVPAEDSAGCFDLRRVVIHELGHVAGLDHPSSAGFSLAAKETVMHAITPARPSPGSSRHAFGRCDVATLQELYDVPTNDAPISSCNDVPTTLALSASTPAVAPGQSVRLRAELQVTDLPATGPPGWQLPERPLREAQVPPCGQRRRLDDPLDGGASAQRRLPADHRAAGQLGVRRGIPRPIGRGPAIRRLGHREGEGQQVNARPIVATLLTASLLVPVPAPAAGTGTGDVGATPAPRPPTTEALPSPGRPPSLVLVGPFGQVAAGPRRRPPRRRRMGARWTAGCGTRRCASRWTRTASSSGCASRRSPSSGSGPSEPLSSGDLSFSGPDRPGTYRLVAETIDSAGTLAQQAWLVVVPDREPPADGIYDIPAPEVILSTVAGRVAGRLGSGCYVYLCVEVGRTPLEADLRVLPTAVGEAPSLQLGDGSIITAWKGRLTSLETGGRGRTIAASGALSDTVTATAGLTGLEPPGTGRWLLELEVELDRERGWLRTYAVMDVSETPEPASSFPDDVGAGG